MSTKNAIVTYIAAQLGSVNVRLQGMYQEDVYSPSIALSFKSSDLRGLCVDLFATTSEVRAFATALIEHADITDKAQAAQVSA